MSGGQLGPFGVGEVLNRFTRNAMPYVSTTAPTQWIPGQMWINTTSGSVPYEYLGTVPYTTASWVASSAVNLYLALLTASPYTSGTGGGAAVYVSDLVEVTTPGYNRQQVVFSSEGIITGSIDTDTYPGVSSNTSAITFGPMTANMTIAAQWAALILSNTASGTVGVLKYYWNLGTGQQVTAGSSIIVPPTDLVLNLS